MAKQRIDQIVKALDDPPPWRAETGTGAGKLAAVRLRRKHRMGPVDRHGLDGDGACKRVNQRALDVVIAATAIEYGLTLVTRNITDYADIPDLTLHQMRVLPPICPITTVIGHCLCVTSWLWLGQA
jgi:predicted nucleic acid-binding protein